MPNTKIRSVTEIPVAAVQMRADGECHPSTVPAFERPAVFEKNCLVPQPKRDSRVWGGLPASRNRSQKSSGREDSTILGSLASHLSISPVSLRKAKNILAGGVAKKETRG